MIGKASTFFRVIESSKKEYKQISTNIDDYYYEKKVPKLDQFDQPKLKNGKAESRILFPSKGRLKTLQKLLNSRVFSQIEFPETIHGAVKKRSCITNARAHQGNKYFLLTDLRNYYPSIHFKIVYDQLVEKNFSPEVAGYITRLVTYNKYLPQGAPTSSFISNLVFLPHDLELIEICSGNGITYTRFIDDLTFSSKDYLTSDIVEELLNVIRKSPFKYHHRKTQMSIGITEITGVCAKNNNLDAPKRKYEKLAQLAPESESAKGLKSHIAQIKKS